MAPVLLCLVLAVWPEPVYRVRWMLSSGPFPAWTIAFVAVRVFLMKLAGLLRFRCYDFVTMLAFRILYSLVWHITRGRFACRSCSGARWPGG